ncbi:hypothetical protein BJI49_11395 [Acetobacter pasteurianus]|uniref:hypothetical protein n=1 Tax=Acetobacter pasteurianus TaxID=438 RepID=UPI00024577BC|nr:hypothetical protein [Acetobacter pasteurianus]RCL05108.1 hypothetical protein BJI49_11395 [Acetobacter pasteurianus]GAB31712.1 O-linked N-acetylglucosamine transferase [Acetobacter pasteurianus subsp. pasteurianus LMG 1262 = NBRC 106471]GCD49552.1 hypothetical protein NBRC106471_1108 [Acetobacter pasteurianus subsp. pasteurianus LMG 1262 = NBRC 106471]
MTPECEIQQATDFLRQGDAEAAFDCTGRLLSLPLAQALTTDQLMEVKALRGIAAYNTRRFDDAVRSLTPVCATPYANATLLSALALAYWMLNRVEEAFVEIRKCVHVEPANTGHLLHAARIATDLNKFDLALGYLLRAQGQDSKSAEIHLAMSRYLLAIGEYQPGWREYEWRDFLPNPGNELPPMTSAPWNGMKIPGGYILVICDQGFGDCLQFVRFVPLARERCEKIILACSKELYPLLRNMAGVDFAFTQWADIPPHAAHCRLSSLPFLLGINDESQFSPTEAYLSADTAKVLSWKKVLEETRPNLPASAPNIGLIWQGRTTHPNDVRRSLSLKQLLPLGEIKGCRFVCLQKPLPEKDIPLLEHFNGMQDWSERLCDYSETAALVKNLDLVISIDSSISHVAGSLGVPAWVLLPQASDWRWGVSGARTAWYPKTKLFRQPSPGAWEPVIDEVVTALQERLWVE